MSTPGTPQRGQWSGGQPTATMPPVPGVATSRRASPTPVGKPRKARLVLARVDPWSVMKLSFLLSIALAVVVFVAVTVLWQVLDAMGVFASVGKTVESVTRSSDNAQGVDIFAYVGFSRVIGLTVMLSGVNVILMTALGTLAAFLYNLAASLVGGMHVTLTEDV